MKTAYHQVSSGKRSTCRSSPMEERPQHHILRLSNSKTSFSDLPNFQVLALLGMEPR